MSSAQAGRLGLLRIPKRAGAVRAMAVVSDVGARAGPWGCAYHVRLNPARRLLDKSPVGVSRPEPVTLNGPPNSFCSALRVRSHLSSVLEMSAPIDTIV